jgi:hypothetical protein
MHWILRGLVFCVLWTAAFGAEAVPGGPHPPAPIAVVRTLAELLAQPQTKLKDAKDREVSVRLGLEAHTADAGTGLLLYAVANTASVAANSIDDLGPVVVNVHREGGEEKVEALQQVFRQWPEAPLYFFAKSVPLPTAGRYRVQVFKPATKELLAETTVEVTQGSTDEPCWYGLDPKAAAPRESGDFAWAGSFQVGTKALPKIPGDEAIPLLDSTADGKMEGSEKVPLPKLFPFKPPKEELAAPDSELEHRITTFILNLGNETYEVREAATQELTALGRRAEPALRRALAEDKDPEMRNRAWRLLRALDGPFTADLTGGVFHLSMGTCFDPTSLYEHLLARWWVNGKPIAEVAAKAVLFQGGGQFRPTRQAALTLDLSQMDLQPADTVEVEFLYCPMGTEEIVQDVMMAQQARVQELGDKRDLFQSLRTLRSNRLKFTASELRAEEP